MLDSFEIEPLHSEEPLTHCSSSSQGLAGRNPAREVLFESQCAGCPCMNTSPPHLEHKNSAPSGDGEGKRIVLRQGKRRGLMAG